MKTVPCSALTRADSLCHKLPERHVVIQRSRPPFYKCHKRSVHPAPEPRTPILTKKNLTQSSSSCASSSFGTAGRPSRSACSSSSSARSSRPSSPWPSPRPACTVRRTCLPPRRNRLTLKPAAASPHQVQPHLQNLRPVQASADTLHRLGVPRESRPQHSTALDRLTCPAAHIRHIRPAADRA